MSETVIFPPGSENGVPECFDVGIVGNFAFEKTESFSLLLSGDASADDNIFVHNDNLVISIRDDDCKSVQCCMPS